MKWVLGLPQGTRSELVDVESGGQSFKCLRFLRAIKYEAQLVFKSSPTLAEAQCAMQRCTTEWGKKRLERTAEYGWTVDGGATDTRMMEERVILCETRRIRHAAKTCLWYKPPSKIIPEYLHMRNPLMRMVARYRCGASYRGNQPWLESMSCRVCGEVRETVEHLVEHDVRRRDIENLLNENGDGWDWMKRMEEFL